MERPRDRAIAHRKPPARKDQDDGQTSRSCPSLHHDPAQTPAGAALTAARSARAGAVRAALALAIALAAALAALPFASPAAPLAGFAAFGLVALVVRDRVGASHPHARFGLANTVTLARAAGAAVFVALAFEPRLVSGDAGWAAAGAAGLLLALDGLDGWLARRQGLASAFGARFDMEADALLILALAAIAFGLGKAGVWVLGLGLIRYAFVLAGLALPALRAELPPSLRRKTVCVLQIAALALLLLPAVQPPASAVLAAGALALLAWSFLVDIRWLLAARG